MACIEAKLLSSSLDQVTEEFQRRMETWKGEGTRIKELTAIEALVRASYKRRE